MVCWTQTTSGLFTQFWPRATMMPILLKETVRLAQLERLVLITSRAPPLLATLLFSSHVHLVKKKKKTPSRGKDIITYRVWCTYFLFSDNIRDFTDCLIAAEREARTEEAPADLAKLTNTHFVQILSDIFSGKSRFFLLGMMNVLYCYCSYAVGADVIRGNLTINILHEAGSWYLMLVLNWSGHAGVNMQILLWYIGDLIVCQNEK